MGNIDYTRAPDFDIGGILQGEIGPPKELKVSRIRRILGRLFDVEPMSTSKDTAPPYSGYSGPVDEAGPLIKARQRLREEGLPVRKDSDKQ